VPKYAYLQGEFLPLEDAKISVMTHAFLYGTAVFEGIRAYWSDEDNQLYIFRAKEHYERLANSCRIMRMAPKHSVKELVELTRVLLEKNGGKKNAYLRPMVYKSNPQVGVKLAGLDDDFLLFATDMGDYLDISKGLNCKVSSWRHVSDNSIPMRCKCSGAYANAALIKTDALDDGYDEAIVLTDDGHVSEGSAENIFIVRDGKLITPPETDDLLPGITRDTVMILAEKLLNIPVEIRRVDRTELYIADEAFFCGTGAQISPIASVDHRPIGNGEVGPIAKKLQDIYFKAVRNQIKEFSNWCTPVYK
jgi:branched-chain amino acid aminotransferase